MPEDRPVSIPIPWQELLETLYRGRWIILATTLIGLLGVKSLLLLRVPVYRAQAKIMLTAQPGSGPREGGISDKQIQAELALLKSPEFIRGILEDYEQEDETGQGVPDPDPEEDDAEQVVPEVIAKRLEAESLGRSNLVQLSFADSDPKWAARFLNDLLAHHVERIARLNEQSNTRSFFQQQRDLANQRWLEARDALTAFREQQGGRLLAGNAGELRNVLTKLESQRVDGETRILELRARLEFLSNEILQHSETIDSETRVMENESEKLLKSRLLELEIQRSELLSRYTPTSTAVRDLDRQIEETKRLLADKDEETLAETMTEANPAHQTLQIELVQTQAQLTEANARVKALSSQIAQYRGELGEIERAAAELERLENEVASAKETNENYRRMEEESRLDNARTESGIVNVVIAERAVIPRRAEPSKTRVKTLIGAFAGLILGTGGVLLRDWLNPSVKSSVQAQRLAGVPVIAEIPAR